MSTSKPSIMYYVAIISETSDIIARTIGNHPPSQYQINYSTNIPTHIFELD